PPEATAGELRAIVVLHHAAHDPDWPLEGSHHLADGDVLGGSRQHVSTFGPVVARDQVLLCPGLEDLCQPLPGDVELLGDALGAHGTVLAMRSDVVDRHQAVVRTLGEPQHGYPTIPSNPTISIADLSSRIFTLRGRYCQARYGIGCYWWTGRQSASR